MAFKLSAANFFEDGFGGGDAVVLGFFEDGDAAEVGVGEVETASGIVAVRRGGARSAEKIAPGVGRIMAWPMRMMSMRETHWRMSEWTRSRSWRMASFQ